MSARRRTLVWVVAAALVAVVVLLVVQQLRAPVPDVSPQASGTVVLEAPVEVVAGDELTVVVRAEGGPVPDLLVTTTATTRLLRPTVDEATGTVVVTGDVTAVTGLLTVTAVGHPTSTTPVRVVPGEVVDPLTPLVGPRTIVADTTDHTMLTLIPLDALGNPVAAGLPVTVEARRPDGALETYDTTTDGLLAWLRVPSGTLAGRTVLGVRLLAARGPAGDVTEVAGPPTEVTLVVEGGLPVADGRSPVALRTNELRDAFGNLVPDGTHAEVVVDGPDGRSLVPAQVVSGRATAIVAAPDRPTTLTFLARVRGVGASPLTVEFAAAVAELPVLAVVEDGEVVVRVGPALDPHGGYVADGTPVVLGDEDDPVASGQLVGGMAVLALEDDGRETVSVTVLGTRSVASVERR